MTTKAARSVGTRTDFNDGVGVFEIIISPTITSQNAKTGQGAKGHSGNCQATYKGAMANIAPPGDGTP